jgi:hypothetical protein
MSDLADVSRVRAGASTVVATDTLLDPPLMMSA